MLEVNYIKPKMKKSQDKFNKIIKAAEKLFFEVGYEKTSIANITSEADVAVGTFYLFFKDKLSLYHFILFDYQKRIKEAMNENIKGKTSREDKEKYGLIAWLKFVNDNPYTYSIIWQSLGINKDLFVDYYRSFTESYFRSLSKDKNELTDIDLYDLSLSLMGISSFVGLKGMIKDGKKISDEEIEKTSDRIILMLKNGMFKK